MVGRRTYSKSSNSLGTYNYICLMDIVLKMSGNSFQVDP